MRVYFAGGMISNWQDKVATELMSLKKNQTLELIDPRYYSNQNDSAQTFVTEDLDFVRDSDVIFAFMEESNPTGYGMVWEMAVAREHKIPIIVVWEKEKQEPFVFTNALYLTTSLDDGIKYLKRYIQKEME